MGLLNWLEDTGVKALTDKETIRLPYEALAEVVTQKLINGADEALLAQVKKTAKGGFLFAKEMKSLDGRYEFHVGARQRGPISMKTVWLFDNEQNKFYQLDKDRRWKKFYRLVDTAVKMEQLNRCK